MGRAAPIDACACELRAEPEHAVSLTVLPTTAKEAPNLREPLFRIGLTQLDKPFDVVGLKHHQAQHVVRARLSGAQAAREKPEGGGRRSS